MAAISQRFFKFPRTPHIAGNDSDIVDDDVSVDIKAAVRSAAVLARQSAGKAPLSRAMPKVLVAGNVARNGEEKGEEEEQKSSLLWIVIQEKVDGANVAVHFGDGGEWDLVAQKRSGEIGDGERHEQFNVFRTFCWDHAEALWPLLGRHLVLFGEWLWTTHGVEYDQLSHYMLAFDVLDKRSGEWWAAERVRKLLANVEAPVGVVPELERISLSGLRPDIAAQTAEELLSAAELDGTVRQSRFSSTERAEGVYLRIENAEIVLDRLKFRRATFTSGRDDFLRNAQRNKLALGSRQHE